MTNDHESREQSPAESKATGFLRRSLGRFVEEVRETKRRPRKRRLFLVTTISLVLGIVLVVHTDIYKARNPGLSSFHTHLLTVIDHVGIGLLVATFVTVLLHLRESEEFFRELASRVMVSHDFLEFLTYGRLKQLREAISKEIVRPLVDNEKHAWESLHKESEEILFERLLPTRSSETLGTYRRELDIDVSITFLAPDEAKSLFWEGSPPSRPWPTDLEFCRFELVSSYEIVSPRRGRPTAITVPFNQEFQPTEWIPEGKRAAWQIGSDRSSAVAVPLTKARSSVDMLRLEGSHSVRLKNGTAKVWQKSTHYDIGKWNALLIYTMAQVSQDLSLRVSISDYRKRKWEVRAFRQGGMGSEQAFEPFSNGAKLRFTGWLLEDHGVSVIWWPAEEF